MVIDKDTSIYKGLKNYRENCSAIAYLEKLDSNDERLKRLKNENEAVLAFIETLNDFEKLMLTHVYVDGGRIVELIGQTSYSDIAIYQKHSDLIKKIKWFDKVKLCKTKGEKKI